MKKCLFTALVSAFISLSAWGQMEQRLDYFLPGAGYTFYSPKGQDVLGNFNGFTGEMVIFNRSKGKNSQMSGPVRKRAYVNFGLMKSDDDAVEDIFMMNAGITVSLEGKTNRIHNLPYVGLQFGGLYQNDFSTPIVTPLFGIHLLSTDQFSWNVQAGYLFAAKRMEVYNGFSFSSTVNIILWNN